ncbi:hypothetical protein CQA49_00025 [Helicobacter sp. MIT 00-7814]|uniref:LPD3 domain-containing protein n=1 Tax=unclassified Helicobacter TaxID=2593540 RepID=UPI000E1EEDC9|nr:MULTISPECIES: LPD23 domain-containing protein [unclassified Helicobacter]RDU57091.1 hypothetical protein CQA49_00025 [Helicobacter sp. MIT 00-7814]RDU57642.1 hypothetical protein CQA37_00025 [Helicobacter sp. MIT 99-10781]
MDTIDKTYKAKIDKIDDDLAEERIVKEWNQAYKTQALELKEAISEHFKNKGIDGVILDADSGSFGRETQAIIALNPNQIKSINNKGTFDSSNPNIMYSSPTGGSGLLGGMVAGIEQDENGNYTFNPQNFILGFLGGAAASKAVTKGLEIKAKKLAKSYPQMIKDNPALFNQIFERTLKSEVLKGVHNSITQFLNKNKIFDLNKQILAGEKALLSQTYAPQKAKLEHAKALQIEGKSAAEIWENTGWYQDIDKNWKFEINPQGGELEFKPFMDMFHGEYLRKESVRLGEILKDEKLFSAYPQLKDMRVSLKTMDSDGRYTPQKGIFLNYRQIKEAKALIDNEKNAKEITQDIRSTLYHEIQHAVQDIEGFDYANARFLKSKTGNQEDYLKAQGEVEARNVQTRLQNKAEIRNPLTIIEDGALIDDEVYKTYQQIAKVQDNLRELQSQGRHSQELENYEKELQAKVDKLQQKRLESLLAQKRVIDNPSSLHPHETIDIPLDQIHKGAKIGDITAKSQRQGEFGIMAKNTQGSRIVELRKNLKEKLSKIFNKDIINDETGISARISVTGFNKIASSKAVSKSVKNGWSRDEHFLVAQNLEQLYKIAHLRKSAPDKKGSADIKAIHRFEAPIRLNDKVGNALLTIKESVEHGNRIYSLELEEISPPL